MSNELLFIIGFVAFIFIMMAIDLGLFGKSDKPVSTKQAAIMSAVWVALALGFYALILNYGNLLHNIHTFNDLRQDNADNLHQLVFNNNDLPGSLQLYRKNLATEF